MIAIGTGPERVLGEDANFAADVALRATAAAAAWELMAQVKVPVLVERATGSCALLWHGAALDGRTRMSMNQTNRHGLSH